MSLATIIYLASVSDGIKLMIMVTGIVGTLFPITAIIVEIIDKERVNKKFAFYLIIGFIICILGIIIPNKDTIYLMAGANATQQAFSTPEAAKARKALNLGLDKIIDNLQESK